MKKINVYAENLGWLFEDLKQHFKGLGNTHGFTVIVSDRPVPMADAWVALRTKEAGISPDIRRTVVCIHDLLFHDGMYRQGGSRRAVREAGALVLSHPEQRAILSEAGISVAATPLLERPLGALTSFTPRLHFPVRFTVGWVGRDHPRKRLDWFVEAMLRLNLERKQVEGVLIGSGLSAAAANLQANGLDCRLHDKASHPIATYPQLYQRLDCVVITSSTEAGPLPLFEALATGLPVVSTPVGWAPLLSSDAPQYLRLASDPHQIAVQLNQLRVERQTMFTKRLEIASLVKDWNLENWLMEVLKLAGSLAPSC